MHPTNHPTSRTKQRKLSELDRQIAERRKYLKDQEILVDDAIADLNTRLQEFHRELEISNGKKISLLKDISRLEEEKEVLEAEVEKVENKLTALDEVYESKVAEYKERLQEML